IFHWLPLVTGRIIVKAAAAACRRVPERPPRGAFDGHCWQKESSFMLKVRLLSILVTTMLISDAYAQNYPSRPIRMLTSEPGGGGDIARRMMSPALTAGLGQPIVIDNRPLAMSGEVVARAQPDGYTATVYGTTLWLGPLLQPMRFDPIRDFAPITILTRS